MLLIEPIVVCVWKSWFIKLYDEPENNLGYNGLGEEFHNILVSAVKSGYRMIELDTDAQVHDEFPTFE